MDLELAVTTRALTKRFGQVLAVDELDLDVPRGGVFGLLGPSGAGKSTVLGLLAGRLRPTGGSATVAGVPVSFGNVELRRKIGVLDEDPSFYDWMTGRELLAFAGDLAGLGRAELKGRVDATLERVGLGGAADERIARYSRPLRRRLGIGQALIAKPEVLLLDDPLGALDPPSRQDVLAVLKALGAEATVVITTELPSDAASACDRIVILDGGRLATPDGVEVPVGVDRVAR